MGIVSYAAKKVAMRRAEPKMARDTAPSSPDGRLPCVSAAESLSYVMNHHRYSLVRRGRFVLFQIQVGQSDMFEALDPGSFKRLSRALPGATVDHYDFIGRGGIAYRPGGLGGQACQTAHLADSQVNEFPSSQIGNMPDVGTARAGEDQLFGRMADAVVLCAEWTHAVGSPTT